MVLQPIERLSVLAPGIIRKLTHFIVVDRFAALLHSRDVKAKAGDVVAVYFSNSPEMVVVLYALSKLGAIAALINTNLRGQYLPRTAERYGPTSNRRYVRSLFECLRRKVNHLDPRSISTRLR